MKAFLFLILLTASFFSIRELFIMSLGSFDFEDMAAFNRYFIVSIPVFSLFLSGIGLGILSSGKKKE